MRRGPKPKSDDPAGRPIIIEPAMFAPPADAGPAPAPEGPWDCPTYLREEAREEWGRVVGRLAAIGNLDRADPSQVATYCAAFARWRAAEDEIRKTGLTSSTDQGADKPNPVVAVADRAIAAMSKILGELGLTPAGRRGEAAPKEADPLAAFLG